MEFTAKQQGELSIFQVPTKGLQIKNVYHVYLESIFPHTSFTKEGLSFLSINPEGHVQVRIHLNYV